MKYPGSGALGCLTAAFIAAFIWRKKGVLEDGVSFQHFSIYTFCEYVGVTLPDLTHIYFHRTT